MASFGKTSSYSSAKTSSASGKRSRLANASRSSMMDVANPARFATFARLFEMWPPPKMKARGLRDHGFDKHVQLAAADQAVVVRGILAQAEIQVPRLAGLDHFAGRVPDLGFHAAAADGARHRAIFPHQQFGALIAGDGAVHLHDGRERAFLAEPAQTHEFVVDVHSPRL